MAAAICATIAVATPERKEAARASPADTPERTVGGRARVDQRDRRHLRGAITFLDPPANACLDDPDCGPSWRVRHPPAADRVVDTCGHDIHVATV
jgi:hypothetical protein